MQLKLSTVGAAAVCLAGNVLCAASEPMMLATQANESVYAPPASISPKEGVNQGGINLDLQVRYMTDYVYRGVNHSQVGGQGNATNLQFDGALSFDLGRAPHPFIGVFTNVYDADPVSRFQEIRPFFGANWELKPLTLEAGNITYIYPEREDLDTAEVYGKITLDDSTLWHTAKPVLSPYILGAYDYNLNNGWYFEAGVKHDFVIEDTGLTLTTLADIAYEMGIQKVFVFDNPKDVGFQHYDLGLLARYSLNSLFNVSHRYGEWSLNGYFYYTGSLAQHILADNLLWGGVGIGLKY